MSELKVGQTLWFVNSQYRNANEAGKGSEVTVEKVGRVWVQLSNGHRIDKESMVADGGIYSSPGVCYLTEGDHKARLELCAVWRAFAEKISPHKVPDGLTIEDINFARLNLKLDGRHDN